uniref:Uncharacterized protein n=1 Tax=Candidatus Kentrum sp. FW TaxID=2126338 RepID=A0A450RT91_9GAMM|nr:MAG: hypothetical protein BECKFW1821A_GA0114235_100167 [Candidatus Kentron sp. FW]
MLDEMDILQEMIRDTARISIQEHNGRRQVTLGEPRDSEGRKVKISGLPNDAIVINVDKFPAPDAVFTCRKGECKRADFIVIADTGKKRVILCIEMKAVKGKESEIVQQLKGTRSLVGYCREVGQIFWKSRGFLDGYQYRFIKIAPNNTHKKTTWEPPKTGTHDKPENMLKIRCARNYRLEFNQLAGKSGF